MCGRFALALPNADRDFPDAFGVPPPEEFTARYNIAPSEPVLAIIADDAGRRVATMRWGLIPSWSDDPTIGDRLINARAESLFEKPSFQRPARTRRCLVPATGFYEWQRRGDRKVPYYVRLTTGEPFGLAGIWDAWRSPDGEVIASLAIVTTVANDTLRPIHHRMPVIVPPERYATWLDPKNAVRERERLDAILQPGPEELIRAHPVSTLVNAPGTDTPACIEPADPSDV